MLSDICKNDCISFIKLVSDRPHNFVDRQQQGSGMIVVFISRSVLRLRIMFSNY